MNVSIDTVDVTPHVLELPTIYTHPSAAVLLETLDALAIKPSAFERRGYDYVSNLKGIGSGNGIPRYLTSIVSNGLEWIGDESLREKVWETASARLSERSGRTAMHSINRIFDVPVSLDPSKPNISITLREPSLTGDCLGHKTWAASYLLAKRLPHLLPFLTWFIDPQYQSARSRHVDLFKLYLANSVEDGCVTPRILELGAGTGLVGLAAAATFATVVHLTDLPEICENLAYNCQLNQSVINGCGGSTSAFLLDWSDLPSDDVLPIEKQYDMILAADSLYSPEHPEMLANTIKYFLRRVITSRVVVELPLREAYHAEVDGFKREMDKRDFQIFTQGEETGWDDWEDGTKEVRCWWGLWGWKTQTNSDLT